MAMLNVTSIRAIRIEPIGQVSTDLLQEGMIAIPQDDGSCLLVKMGGFIINLGKGPGMSSAHTVYAVVDLVDPPLRAKSYFIEEYSGGARQTLRIFSDPMQLSPEQLKMLPRDLPGQCFAAAYEFIDGGMKYPELSRRR